MQFGIPLFGQSVSVIEGARIELAPGRIILLLGPSGSGKSTALGQIQRQFGGGSVVSRVLFPTDVAIVDRIAPWAPLGEALSVMSACALGEPHLWVRRFSELSDGEKFRARLARALSLHARGGASKPLICDEYCSNLHRRAAKAISFNLRKLVDRRKLCVVLASSNEDIVSDLQPDVIVHLRGQGRCSVEICSRRRRRSVSFRRRLKIVRGSLPDYHAFSAMHYRSTEQLALIDKVFLLREGADGEPLAVVTYGYCSLELSLRRKATGGRYSRNPQKLNRSFRVLRRLVVHPDVRGCGLGHYLVEKTLPMVGTLFVECLASMGSVNPVFEKAGMERVGHYDISAKNKRALAALTEMDVDPNAREFCTHVLRRPRVRRIVTGVVYSWYQATTTNPDIRLKRQSPESLAQIFRGIVGSQPVYYLWRKTKIATKGARVH